MQGSNSPNGNPPHNNFDAAEQDSRMQRFLKGEPPRLYRRVIYLSQAAMPDRVKLS